MSDNTTNLKARPEDEDFAHKYTEEGQGKIGGMLIDNYFKNVSKLIATSGIADVSGAKAIEIGCGMGFSTQRLAGMLPQNVTLEASEYVANMIPEAQKLNPGMKITEESVYETQHQDNEFDLVFLLEVLEHLDFPDKALEELNRITKPGGMMILGVPREPLWCMLNMARGYRLKHFGNTEGHLNHWSTHGIKKYVGKHFGPIVETKTPLPWSLVRAIKK
jgi:2-polyprenyl-3-methyl-5-hydroxy-6-metoxy-1,4-benzoquinol methylase